ncbi:GTP cyclohydrolase II [Sphingomonas daechungensis]|uniref:GTP cyclohydrolase-2 n=1 Tax=Sphingomonas daechungensis TaxID=1176646 RepID=A0ABX6T2Q7_9SPHN|nr:GTP cyclohydrolase II [Sphingomonas daechungensis]QNP44167.1 GTP cyclohydrolase II [Sphingomonas daechungensis]
MSREHAVERAIAALRTGRAVTIEGDEPLSFVSIETATSEALKTLDPKAKAQLLLSGRRAAALSLANERDAADPAEPVLLARESWLDGKAALTLADPAQDFARAPIGPLHPLPIDTADSAKAALALTRAAGLLPAAWVVQANDGAVAIALDQLTNENLRPEVTLLSRARLPLEDMPDTQIFAFRGSDDGQEHVALLVGAFGGKPPLVRLHSECLTGDVFGSLKCDCGPQLKEALRLIGESGGGVLLYLRQEGRGIGLANKLRAYALQDRGLDTVDANLRLGFSDDEREYAHAAAILRQLGIDEVRLLTNNPNKVAALEAEGIRVAERVAHHMPANPHNADYLDVKRSKSGHLA